MKLQLNEVKKITFGAERIIEQDGLINFFRFSEQEEALYKKQLSPSKNYRYNPNMASGQ